MRVSTAVGALFSRRGWVLGIALVGGCKADFMQPIQPDLSSVEQDSTQAQSLESDRRYSVFIEHHAGNSGAIIDEVQSLADGGVWPDTVNDVVTFDIHSSRLPAVALLRSKPWARRIVVDSQQNYLLRVPSWGYNEMQAGTVHNTGNVGQGVKVAVLDGGVDCSHPDLLGRVKGGYDFVTNTPTFCHSQNTGGVMHGTGAAGVIAAATNGVGNAGIAPGADIYSLRVCTDAGTCSSGQMAVALSWASTNGMHVISVSIGNCGGSPNSFIHSYTKILWQQGRISMWGAGNGVESVPACSPGSGVSSHAKMPEAVAVSAHGSSGSHLVGYQYGPEVDISAPAGVLSTSTLGGHQAFGGTSSATPHVAGTLALIMSAGNWASDSFAARKLVQRLLSSAVDDATYPGFDIYYGFGKVNAFRAVNWLTNAAINGPTFTQTGVTTWTASSQGGIPPLTYFWERADDPCTLAYYPVSTVSSYAPNTVAGERFRLRLTIGSPALGASWTVNKFIGGVVFC